MIGGEFKVICDFLNGFLSYLMWSSGFSGGCRILTLEIFTLLLFDSTFKLFRGFLLLCSTSGINLNGEDLTEFLLIYRSSIAEYST